MSKTLLFWVRQASAGVIVSAALVCLTAPTLWNLAGQSGSHAVSFAVVWLGSSLIVTFAVIAMSSPRRVTVSANRPQRRADH